MNRKYCADDVPHWIIRQFDRIDYNKASGTEIEKVCVQLQLYANVTFLSFKKSINQTKYVDCNIPQQILDTISQIDFKKINAQKEKAIEESLTKYITTSYGAVLR